VTVTKVDPVREVSRPANRFREIARQFLALAFTLLTVAVVILSFRSANQAGWPEVKEWLTIVFPAVTGLLGSAVGFYFGERSREE
jgi:uncharacterized membrane protein YfcA